MIPSPLRCGVCGRWRPKGGRVDPCMGSPGLHGPLVRCGRRPGVQQGGLELLQVRALGGLDARSISTSSAMRQQPSSPKRWRFIAGSTGQTSLRNEVWGAARGSGEHDDLLLAVSPPIWHAGQPRQLPYVY